MLLKPPTNEGGDRPAVYVREVDLPLIRSGSPLNADSSLPSLTRAQSSLIRQLLQEKKVRTQEGAFVVEGAKSCLDLMRWHPNAILSITVSPQYLQLEPSTDRNVRSALGCQQFLCSDTAFQKLSDVEAPQGMLAVVRQPQWDPSRIFTQKTVCGVYGDRLRDPANVGTIIRTAAAMNLSGVWLSVDSVDPFSPKVVRAAAGTLLTLPVFRTQNIQQVVVNGCDIYAALVPSTETIPIRNIQNISPRMMIAVGNEGSGLSEEVIQRAHVKFSIPIAADVESLNVAATVAIAAFHFRGLPIDEYASVRTGVNTGLSI